MTQRAIEIKLSNGLEARPIAVLVQVASKYESSIYIESGDKKVNAKSIMGMMSLSLRNGESIVVNASGADEQEAANDIERFLRGSGES